MVVDSVKLVRAVVVLVGLKMAALPGVSWLTAWADGVTCEEDGDCDCKTPVAARAASLAMSLAAAATESSTSRLISVICSSVNVLDSRAAEREDQWKVIVD